MIWILYFLIYFFVGKLLTSVFNQVYVAFLCIQEEEAETKHRVNAMLKKMSWRHLLFWMSVEILLVCIWPLAIFIKIINFMLASIDVDRHRTVYLLSMKEVIEELEEKYSSSA